MRRQALVDVGGWDPYNVTEDADLGLRLARFGYRTEMIACPTYEDGPADARTWLPQRTRWFKGWFRLFTKSDMTLKSLEKLQRSLLEAQE